LLKNIAADKYYSDAYQKIKNTVVVPLNVLENCYSDDKLQHIYDQNEINSFIDKWKSA